MKHVGTILTVIVALVGGCGPEATPDPQITVEISGMPEGAAATTERFELEATTNAAEPFSLIWAVEPEEDASLEVTEDGKAIFAPLATGEFTVTVRVEHADSKAATTSIKIAVADAILEDPTE
jgi:hypothetical protein